MLIMPDDIPVFACVGFTRPQSKQLLEDCWNVLLLKANFYFIIILPVFIAFCVTA